MMRNFFKGVSAIAALPVLLAFAPFDPTFYFTAEELEEMCELDMIAKNQYGKFEILPSEKMKFYIRYSPDIGPDKIVHKKSALPPCRFAYHLDRFRGKYTAYFDTKEQAKEAIDSILKRWENEEQEKKKAEKWIKENPPEVYPQTETR